MKSPDQPAGRVIDPRGRWLVVFAGLLAAAANLWLMLEMIG